MRRKVKFHNPKITRKYYSKSFKPWFIWTKCNHCHMEIKREIMYRVGIKWYSDGYFQDDSYALFCSKCFPTIQKAYEYFKNNENAFIWG